MWEKTLEKSLHEKKSLFPVFLDSTIIAKYKKFFIFCNPFCSKD